MTGQGGALLDYDGDGDLDAYLVQSAGGPNRLFRNDLNGTGMQLVDVTAGSGCGDEGYGMGVATGDYDNDGDPDLYVLNFGANLLCRNNGDGTFTDVTEEAGVNDARWSVSGSFVDYDRDGDLDLYVANYVEYSADIDKLCYDGAGQRDYCAPTNYAPAGDSLFRNEGDGRFTDVSEASGIAARAGPGLGVVAADLNGDGLSDLYVANDQAANFLWLNRGDGTFEETGLMAGAAYNRDGAAEASMGVTAGDYDGDGDDDLFMTHLTTQSNTLYVNDGGGNFHDGTERAGLGAESMVFTGFGSAWLDYDNDGALDLFVANGAVMVLGEQRGKAAFPYAQTNQLFHNGGDGHFEDVSASAGPAFAVTAIGRGAAFGDIDNDGDIDILVTDNGGPARLLRNELGNARNWLRFTLRGTASGADAQGARVAIELPDGSLRWSRAHTDGSFASASDPRVHFGLGDAEGAAGVLVEWPAGARERWPAISANQPRVLVEGGGMPVSPGPGK
ncbi:MAG: CRTAC1 family protein [Gammaproteobacteria bacterium]|nr:CRTAC1 family protein [Gammaproteobacteria bacterium]